MVQYWNGAGVYAGLGVEDGAILATANAAAAMESITAAGGRELAIENYKKELGLFVAPPEEGVVRVMDKRQRPRSFPARALTGLTPIFGNRGGMSGLRNVGRTCTKRKAKHPLNQIEPFPTHLICF